MSKSIIKTCTHQTTTVTRQRSSSFCVVEDFILVWLDLTINESDNDIRSSIFELQCIVNFVYTFTDSNQCADFITETTNEKILLIISGSLVQQLLPLIENIIQIERIYIFCTDKAVHEQWTKKYQKVKGVFTQIQHICEMLKKDVRQSESLLAPISIMSTASSTNMNELDQSFMYSQLLKEILIDLPHDENNKKELVNYCRQQYAGNNRELRIIDEFEQKYDRPSPIWWYTRECFTYSMLNKALRTQDLEIIIKMGFFARDLHRQIAHLHSESDVKHSFVVYRGQGMLNDEFAKLKKSKGCLLSFNNFLSTSVKREISMGFVREARNNHSLTGILFHIEVEPSMSSTPFASLDKISYYSDREKEVLFSMHTVFRIGEMKEIENRLWQVNLTLTSDDDQQLTQLTQYMREAIGSGTGMHRIGQLMLRMGELNKAEEIYTILLERTSDDDLPQLALLHHQLGYINDEKGDLSTALSHYKQSLNIELTHRLPNDSQLSTSYSNIGAVLKVQGDLDGALEHFARALTIDIHALQPNQLKIATRHNNIGSTLEAQREFAEALKSYERALEILLKHLPPSHPSLAIAYSNIGSLHCSMREYSKALSYCKKTLEVQNKSLPPNHPSMALAYHNIATALFNLHRYKQAFEHAKRAVDIARHAFDSNHPDLNKYQNFLNRLQQML